MLIDGEKWACEACVRGHRVTTCKHNDRPLIRINRKGRPFATCSICNCTPCESPEEHAKLKRETEHHHPSSSSKRAAGRSPRLSASPTTFLPIAPRPSISPSTSAAASANSPLPAAAAAAAAAGAYASVSAATTLPGCTTATAAGYLSPPPIASLPPSFCSMAATHDSMAMSMANPLLVDAHRMYSDLAVSFADSNAIYALDEMGLDDVSATMLAADPVFQGNDWDWLHDDHHDGGVL
ncbi:hypothetical protein AnigIFM60653_001637 [Aspergillus niger]|nr:hypothetical protein AnigIFM50267_010737 [Aspergillus niger]GLA02235.1 hypothetical protein AnigIFM60653_001637 [Aspergillus niger]GLA20467.1 hypothetical protein AnigIFM62618_009041 [Aspergillus niger]